MKMNVVDHAGMKAFSARNGSRMGSKCRVLLLLVISVAFGAGGCADDYYGGYYGASPGYGPGPYYGGGPYGRGYAAYPGYGPGAVTVEIGDRPYYTRGAGYYVGRSYYVWRPGHWRLVNGRRVWIHGHYVIR